MKLESTAAMLRAARTQRQEATPRVTTSALFLQQLLAAEWVAQPSLSLSLGSDTAQTGRGRLQTRRVEGDAAVGGGPSDPEHGKVRVAFYGEDEAPVAQSGANPVVIAHVIGDEVLSMRAARRTTGGAADQKVPARRVVVEMLSDVAGQAAKLTVMHPDLGPMELRVSLRAGAATIEITAATPRAARAVIAAEQGLREALRNQDIRLERVSLPQPALDRKPGRVSPYAALDEEA